METKLQQVSTLKVGSFVLFDNVASKVTDIQISKTGKHGHAKCRITAVGLVDSQKRIKVIPGDDKIDIPIIEKESAQVLSIQEDAATVMDSKTYETFDLKIPSELKDSVKEGATVLYWIIMGEKVMREAR